MTEYTNEKLGIRFTLPEAPSVGQQLRYRGRVFATGFLSEDIYIRSWIGFLGLYNEWESELIPNPKELNLETETNPKVADAMQWVCNITAKHMNELEIIDPNS